MEISNGLLTTYLNRIIYWFIIINHLALGFILFGISLIIFFSFCTLSYILHLDTLCMTTRSETQYHPHDPTPEMESTPDNLTKLIERG